jgi:uncharacterized membrane protein
MRFDPEAFRAAEEGVRAGVQWLRLGVEATGAAVIALGVIVGAIQFVAASRRGTRGYNDIRLTLARYLAVALEFQLGADILSTAIAPSWDQIGKLAAIAIIRTGLNYFLGKEMELEKSRGGDAGPGDRSPTPTAVTV